MEEVPRQEVVLGTCTQPAKCVKQSALKQQYCYLKLPSLCFRVISTFDTAMQRERAYKEASN